NKPIWSQMLGPGVTEKPYGSPSPHEAHVVRRNVGWLTSSTQSSINFTPLQDLHGIITPNGLHFERHHGGVPSINPNEHRLIIHGMVKYPMMFTMDELMRFPSESHIHFIECPANGGMEWKGVQMQTVQFTHGMVSCCEWTGVKVSTLLQEVGVDPKGTWVLAEGADGGSMDRSIPMEKMMDDAMICWAQNGERLRPEQGYPIRLLVPGFEGNMNIKWLRRLKVGTEPWMTREETSKYTDLMDDGTARQFTFLQEANSCITYPSAGQQMSHKGFHEITGLAWSGRGKIQQVDVSVDGGRNWHTASLQEPVMSKCLTRFRIPWQWNGEKAHLQSRAMDETGYVQPTITQLREVRGINSIYHKNSIYTWEIDTNGEVKNVQLS
ncbi:MAG: sulfite dehydrogenase, partial [SAR324 cluster bacterium]|nr:sulfite dehydrogenase [SAR324 cluster bacterium]